MIFDKKKPEADDMMLWKIRAHAISHKIIFKNKRSFKAHFKIFHFIQVISKIYFDSIFFKRTSLF